MRKVPVLTGKDRVRAVAAQRSRGTKSRVALVDCVTVAITVESGIHGHWQCYQDKVFTIQIRS